MLREELGVFGVVVDEGEGLGQHGSGGQHACHVDCIIPLVGRRIREGVSTHDCFDGRE
jgi:hypothetical protein